jgi:dCTP deaminase
MILSDDGIIRALDKGDIEIDPCPTDVQYTTSAVDLLIGDKFLCWDSDKLRDLKGFTGTLNLSEQNFLSVANAYLIPMKLESDGTFLFPPYGNKPMHVLGITRERVHLKPGSLLAGRVEGRSSMARYGLTVHLTAPTIHAGFNGQITLEMINYGPFMLKLVPNSTRICQLVFERLESPPLREIRTKFQGQTQPSGKP